ncbi:hypothetical protein pipiens_005546 [Culex pipiens pipiens]|uniref:Uncharacterized protein n=1 Tax=Culex pipiens pipiens TaxID=38569 RepID=A0ABD1DWI7_CULPP
MEVRHNLNWLGWMVVGEGLGGEFRKRARDRCRVKFEFKFCALLTSVARLKDDLACAKMPSKQRRGTGDPRWSPQRCSSTSNDSSPSVSSRPSTSTATHALLLTSLTVFLSNLLSSAHGNPLNPFAPSL